MLISTIGHDKVNGRKTVFGASPNTPFLVQKLILLCSFAVDRQFGVPLEAVVETSDNGLPAILSEGLGQLDTGTFLMPLKHIG
jgi:hypothetical protein